MNRAGQIGNSHKRLALDICARSPQKVWAGTTVKSSGPAVSIALIRDLLAVSQQVYANWRFPLFTAKKLPWVEAIAAELIPAKVKAHDRLGYPGKAKPDVVLPSFGGCLIRPALSGGQNPATRSVWTSHPLKWSWHLNALPRSGQPLERGMTGEVSEQGRMRSGAGREAKETPCAPRISGKRRYAQSTGE